MENTNKNNNKKKKNQFVFLTQYHYILGHSFFCLFFYIHLNEMMDEIRTIRIQGCAYWIRVFEQGAEFEER
jgi:hypothetical protein